MAGRPKLENPRDRQLNIGLTESEFAALHQKARAAGLRPVDYARAKLFARAVRALRTATAVRQLDPLLLVALSRVGNNLNQIARRLNELAMVTPDELAFLLAELRRILREAGV